MSRRLQSSRRVEKRLVLSWLIVSDNRTGISTPIMWPQFFSTGSLSIVILFLNNGVVFYKPLLWPVGVALFHTHRHTYRRSHDALVLLYEQDLERFSRTLNLAERGKVYVKGIFDQGSEAPEAASVAAASIAPQSENASS